MARITFKAAADELRPLGVSLTRTAVPGEFRVALAGQPARKAQGYFTEDLQDAVNTGRAMAAERAREIALFDRRVAQARSEGWDVVTA